MSTNTFVKSECGGRWVRRGEPRYLSTPAKTISTPTRHRTELLLRSLNKGIESLALLLEIHGERVECALGLVVLFARWAEPLFPPH